jgi:hypothetical protein
MQRVVERRPASGATTDPFAKLQAAPIRRIDLRAIDPSDPELALVVTLVQDVHKQLKAEAITVAVRRDGDERLLVCTPAGEVKSAAGSLSLGLICRGATRLAGGPGLLQAVECCGLFGFVPSSYLGVPFEKKTDGLRGGVAVWSRRPRRWSIEDGASIRRLAAYCTQYLAC